MECAKDRGRNERGGTATKDLSIWARFVRWSQRGNQGRGSLIGVRSPIEASAVAPSERVVVPV